MNQQDYNNLDDLEKLKWMQQEYLKTYEGCYNHPDSAKHAARLHRNGFELDEYGSITLLYASDYILHLVHGTAHIYKKVRQ